MLVRTHPRKSGDDFGVGDGCASCCGCSDRTCAVDEESGTTFCVMDCDETSGCKRMRGGEHSCERGVCTQRRRYKKGEGKKLFVHANVTSTGEFDWGETAWEGKSVRVFEDLEAFIGELRDAESIVVWKGIYWGRQLGLEEEIRCSIDMWCCMASSQAFVPKLSQFEYTGVPACRDDGDASVVGQIMMLYKQWEQSKRLRYKPLNGGKYPWETVRGWSCEELCTPMICAKDAIPAPSWMDTPLDLNDATKWLVLAKE